MRGEVIKGGREGGEGGRYREWRDTRKRKEKREGWRDARRLKVVSKRG